MKKIYLSIICLIFGASAYAQQDTADVVNNDTAAATNFQLPVFNTSDDELESQDVSSLLQSSKDVFTSVAGFHFSPARFRFRGYNAENQTVLVNGVNVNSLETGFASWNSWGGLNDVTRYTESRSGISASRLTFGGVGGYTNIDTRASSFKKGTRFSYANANRTYRNRFMLTHSTGMMSNGWAITISGSARLAERSYVPGTNFNAYSYYASIDKKINAKHMLSFVGFGAPMSQARQSLETQEVYDLAGSHYYNSYWGYQDGKARSGKVATSHKPMLMLSHIFNINSNSKLTSSVYYTFGKSALSNINWYDAMNPHPDYYKYLPSYYSNTNDFITSDYLTSQWQTNLDVRQIHWDEFYWANSKNLYTVQNANGVAGNNIEGNRSKYILEDQVSATKQSGFNVVYNTRYKNFFITAGANGSIFKDNKYRVITDLLGGDYWLDYDMFAENLGTEQSIAMNNLDEPNKLLKVGDKYGYNYVLNVNNVEGWGQVEYSLNKLDVYASVSLGSTTMWRTGNYRNGKFPENSKGDSEKKNFMNYGLKGGATYKLTGRHFLVANGAVIQRAPEATVAFISPRTRNDVVSGLRSENVYSFDVSYMVKYPNLKARLTYYNTQIKNQTWLRSYFNDIYNNNVNYIMTGVNQSNTGIELGVEGKLFTSFVLTGVLSAGQYIYTSRPMAQIWQDNSAKELAIDRTVYLKNYHIGNMPQTCASFGFKYNGKQNWFAGFNINYFDGIYVEPNPDRRTAEAVSKYITDDPQYHQLIDQEKLPAAFLVDANAGKSFRVKSYFINLNVSVSNVLNNKNFKNGGMEQLRYDNTLPSKFPNKYSYALGTTYQAQISFTF
ncbi:MAG: TonB-dependent receptor [Bacteroidetes bacterium]|nr:TonB-dependent receptor [Bacteroidota bacterium]